MQVKYTRIAQFPAFFTDTRHHPHRQDRPDLIVSELSGLAFDSLQQAFRPKDISTMFDQVCLEERNCQAVYLSIDPAAGGPASDYAMVSITRHKGMVTVSTPPPPPPLHPR